MSSGCVDGRRGLQCNFLSADALARASGAEEVLRPATVFASVEEAVHDVHSVYATTARIRAFVTKMISAEEAGREAAEAEREGARSGFLFGSENAGLANLDL